MTSGFPSQRASNTECVAILWGYNHYTEHTQRHRYEQQGSLIDSLVHHEYQGEEDEEEDQQEDDDGVLEDNDPLAQLGPQARPIIQGHWENLPPMPSNIVRIFMSSTFAGESYHTGHHLSKTPC